MQICLTVIEGPHQGQAFPFGGHDTFVVGRSKHAHFRLPHKDKYFSRIHFLMEVNPPRCRVVDMGSRNGTYVNGKKILSADLKDGDLITAGRSVLRIAVVPEADDDTKPQVQPRGGRSLTAVAKPVQGYQTVMELGRGGMGVVYLANRESDNAVVALKVIVPAVAASPRELERFVQAAGVLRMLDHPSIVKCFDVGESNGRLFVAMEHVDGMDTAQIVKQKGPLPIRPAVEIMCEVLAALEFAHARRLVHRDIKPSNVLVAKAGGVKVADFGLAKLYQASQLSGLTMTGNLGGSAGFMPPELITRYGEAKPAADQYAVAATLYYLLTGKTAHDVPRKTHLHFAKVLHDEPVPLRQRRPEVSEALAKLVHQGLARERVERFRNVKEFRLALSKTL
ncbi:MAG TPA: FHA domain-containing serine/threonine-protein kinase [Gemmataceae bacterium]|nr:FHA domain-containing serine/threonine-protein kinase [Gemmataceae bacterium]